MKSETKFFVLDYVIFISFLVFCGMVGLYYWFMSKRNSSTGMEHLTGGRNMSIFPISVSLAASLVSGTFLLGFPAEIYLYGTQIYFTVFGTMLAAVIFSYTFLPLFHELGITSVYEYLERRFCKQVRLFGSLLFALARLLTIPIVIYGSALALSSMVNISIHFITVITCFVCVFYTCLGGFKAVVWTDVLQMFVTFGALFVIVVKGTLSSKGIWNVFDINFLSGRIEGPDFDLDPTKRYTFWSGLVGYCFYVLVTEIPNQVTVQRYISLPSIRSARWALFGYVLTVQLIAALYAYVGFMIYAKYEDCDPLTSKKINKSDQLFPLLVIDMSEDFPGLLGIFTAGLFSACLSTVSSLLNSLAVVILEDFYRPMYKKNLTESQVGMFTKGVIMILGSVSLGMLWVVEKLGSIVQTSMSLITIASSSLLSVFVMGAYIPWVNSLGALIGSSFGTIVVAWISVGAQTAIATGAINYETKPLSISGCNSSFHYINATNYIASESPDIFVFYRLSYHWYALIGVVVSIITGVLVSWISGFTDPSTLDPLLLGNGVRKWSQRTKIPVVVEISPLPRKTAS